LPAKEAIMPDVIPMKLAPDERARQTFQWRDPYPFLPLRYVSWCLTNRRILALVHEENLDEWAWNTFYDFHDLGEGMQVTIDDDLRLYLDLFPPRTLRLDGLTIEEV
jgi:hypothetical protein